MHENSFDNTSVSAALAVNQLCCITSMLIGLCCVNNRIVSFALGFSFACRSFAHETRNRSLMKCEALMQLELKERQQTDPGALVDQLAADHG